MSDETPKPEKRFTLRMDEQLWRDLHAEAGKQAIPVAHLVNRWLQEKVTEAKREGR